MVEFICNPNTWEVEVQDHPRLNEEFKVILGYMRPKKGAKMNGREEKKKGGKDIKLQGVWLSHLPKQLWRPTEILVTMSTACYKV